MKSSFAYLLGAVYPFGAGPNDPALIEGPASLMPASLLAFYAGNPVISGTVYRLDANNYGYRVLLTDGTIADGVCKTGTVAQLATLTSVGGLPVYSITGQLTIGPPTGARIVQGPNSSMPANLITFYQAAFGGPYNIIGGTIFYTGVGTNYTYDVYLDNNSRARGAYNSIANVLVEQQIEFINTAPNYAGVQFGQNTAGRWFMEPGTQFSVQGETIINPLNAIITAGGNNDIVVDGNSMGRGLVARTSDASNVFLTPANSTAETDITTLHTAALFKTGRAYSVRLHGYLDCTSICNATLRCHLTTAAGTTVGLFGVFNIAFASLSVWFPVNAHIFVKNVTGADITRTLVPTINSLLSQPGQIEFRGGGLTVGTNEASLDVYDEGPAASFPNAFAIT